MVDASRPPPRILLRLVGFLSRLPLHIAPLADLLGRIAPCVSPVGLLERITSQRNPLTNLNQHIAKLAQRTNHHPWAHASSSQRITHLPNTSTLMLGLDYLLANPSCRPHTHSSQSPQPPLSTTLFLSLIFHLKFCEIYNLIAIWIKDIVS